MAPITPKQKQILDFITEFQSNQGYAPSQQEIAKAFDFKSLGTVQNYLVRLERQGYLKKSLNARRGIEVQSPSPQLPQRGGSLTSPQPSLSESPFSLPLLGRVAAGKPIEAVDHSRTLEVPASMVGTGEHFVLQVEGDSMIEDGILNGDYVVVKSQSTARNGQTVVALVNHEATIKRFFQKQDQVELHPANPAYEPIIIPSLVDGMDFKIAGVMSGLIRKLE